MEIREIKQDKENILLGLHGEFTIRHVARLKGEFLSYAEQYKGIALDLSGVSEIDSAGFQLLLLLKKYLTKLHGRLRLINHSLPVLKILDLYGAIGIFGDKIKVPADEKKNLSLAYGVNRDLRFGA